MTPERAKKLLPIITAFAEGKPIQLSNSLTEGWIDTDSPNWSITCGYRIKPELVTVEQVKEAIGRLWPSYVMGLSSFRNKDMAILTKFAKGE